MTPSKPCDVAIIGGGIVGMATALELAEKARLTVTVLEAEDRLSVHQTGHNTGVIHSGIYNRPGTWKARFCVAGQRALYRFCAENGIKYERCGKVIIATRPSRLPGLSQLQQWAGRNGVCGVRWLTCEQARELEPHVNCVAGLHVPETGIVDFAKVNQGIARRVEAAGGVVQLRARVYACKREGNGFLLETTAGEASCRFVVNCAGVQSDRIARLCGIEPGVTVIPFRGQFYAVRDERRDLVRNLVYPVPDLRLPFLGIHLTRTIEGHLEGDPNGALALHREGHREESVSVTDVVEMLAYPGFWRMLAAYFWTGIAEARRAHSRRAFVAALQELVPDLRAADLRPSKAGVHAQAIDPTGAILDDFRILSARGMVHVLNATSPAATASLALGEHLGHLVLEQLGLPRMNRENR